MQDLKLNGYGTMMIPIGRDENGEIIRKEYPFYLNNYQSIKFCELRGIDFKEYDELFKVENLSKLSIFENLEMSIDYAYAALLAGAKKNKSKLPFDEVDMYDMISFFDEGELKKPFEVIKQMSIYAPDAKKS